MWFVWILFDEESREWIAHHAEDGELCFANSDFVIIFWFGGVSSLLTIAGSAVVEDMVVGALHMVGFIY